MHPVQVGDIQIVEIQLLYGVYRGFHFDPLLYPNIPF